MTSTSESLRSPLHARHEAAGAKFAEFGGWDMPLEYSGGGVVAEHTAVREQVGVFDVSHLGKVDITGPGAADFVNSCLSNDLGKISPGKAQYTLCCDPAGGVVDDMIAYLYGPDRVFLVPNAANNAEVAARLAAAAPEGVTVTNQHTDYAVLAVQGPKSTEVLKALGLPTEHSYMSFDEGHVGGATVIVCRTGYTGEHGYELVIPAAAAVAAWDEILTAGVAYDIRPAGLGARDTLRTEMGYPLHGHELSLDITPVQARAGWAVGWKKDAFWGKEPLAAEKAAGPARRLWGLEATGRGIPRADMNVLSGETVVGVTTSGTFSPTKKVGIALALLDTAAELAEGAELEVDVRGRRLPVKVVKPPFVDPSVK
ncbi:glycine cleavage system aminomethyltransferase GcvT [Stackebrandtia nassauensis]|uniref:Aminomethyltransferase n=1 Tax=Stackebrandtia nassauensis (strain DSM 44728 / CIP 108903 / NRRL B-16338 / NBRC 102104 / LLR-40K-21) TaxID=446470 RepID=D3Q3W7_STANL|nr:glycine cleavage system aminomethyltransferase GcvT [Stackebrandtia nassauensis]ADD44034.1 glycine cleavage system T protein [Stackebrandtia nassauensis DSM 44728]